MKAEMKNHIVDVCNKACGNEIWCIDEEGFIECDGSRLTDHQMMFGPLVWLFSMQPEKVIQVLQDIKDEVEYNALPEDEIMELVYRRMPV